MRIRKRFPPSSPSTVPVSDPQLNRSPVVQQQHIHGRLPAHPHGSLGVKEANSDSQLINPLNWPRPPFSDLHTMIGIKKPRWVCSSSAGEQKVINQKESLEGEEVKDETWREEENNNYNRKGNILGAEVGAAVLLPSGSSSHQVVGRWCDGDKVVPLKKRILNLERSVSEEAIMENGRKMKAKMKSKTNKKCVRQNGYEQEGKESEEGIEKPSVKKSKRGSVIMEGSRCSRVNGRGWRCCQQTLVGYSLCEHHLGKGRLRSIVSVRNQAMASNPSVIQKDELEKANQQEKRLVANNDEDDDDDDQKKPLMVRKKRMKLGMVKARSISSLLSQTDNAVVVADNCKSSS